jgi:hypothetical protein
MASDTDVRLVSLVELITQKSKISPFKPSAVSLTISQAQIYETLTSMNGQVNHNTLAFIRRASEALDKWWRDCDELHRPSQSSPYFFSLIHFCNRTNNG